MEQDTAILMPDENTSPPAAEKPRRKSQDKMGEEQKKELRELCMRPDLRLNGKIHIPTLEKVTGFSYGKIYGFINNDKYLNAQLADANANNLVPVEGDAIDGDMPKLPPGMIHVTKEQFDEYEKLMRQNRKMLAGDWEKLGVDPEDAGRMEHYTTLGAAPMSGILRLFSGQLLSNANILDRVIKDDAERILRGTLPPENDKEGLPRDEGDVQREWRYTLFAGMQLQLQITSHIHKIQALAARVMADMQKLGGGKSPESKGNFQSRGT